MHTCSVCGKSFGSESYLAIHSRYHTGERPYRCNVEQCDATFFTAGHLAEHTRGHTGERPYACNQCPAKFKRHHHLAVHNRVHTGERPYSCACGARFIKQYNLDMHVSRTHTIEGQLRQKRKEQALADFLTSHGFQFKREHRISFE